MLLTRPDTAYAIQWLLTWLAKPYIEHLNAAKNLLRYLKGSQYLAYIYRGSNTPISTSLIGYCDSDFAGDKATSKSTYAYLFTLAGGPICWKSKKSTTIALSTLEAKADAISKALREIQWL